MPPDVREPGGISPLSKASFGKKLVARLDPSSKGADNSFEAESICPELRSKDA